MKYLKRIIGGIVIIFLLSCTVLFVFQHRFIFHPKPINQEGIKFIRTHKDRFKNVEITTQDSTKLCGWLLQNQKKDSTNLLIYLGGNAEEVSHLADEVARFKNWNVILMNYRGYGKSEGKPNEKKLYRDALEIFDNYTDKDGYKVQNVVAMGRSLGTGVATYLAQERNLDGVILVSPYDKLGNIAQMRYPFFPVKLLLRYRFNSIKRAPHIEEPVKIVIGTEDQVVPPKYSHNLAEKWGGEVDISTIKNVGHLNIFNKKKVWNEIEEFLKRCKRE